MRNTGRARSAQPSARACYDRYKYLLRQFRVTDRAALARSGTAEDFTRKMQQLTELQQLETAAAEASQQRRAQGKRALAERNDKSIAWREAQLARFTVQTYASCPMVRRARAGGGIASPACPPQARCHGALWRAGARPSSLDGKRGHAVDAG
jgi:hypothetical protein